MLSLMKLVGKYFVEIVIAVVLLCAGAFVVQKVSEVRNFFFPNDVIVQNSRTIVTGLQGLGQLVTVSVEAVKTNVQVSVNQGFLNAGHYKANHIAVGVVEAGINFDAINEDSVKVEDDVYTITLPHPEITSCRIEHIDQNQHSFTLLSADWDLVRQLAQHEALAQFVDDLLEGGILAKAKEETAWRIGDFAARVSGMRVSVEYADESSEAQLPVSCQPDAPSGWARDDDGGWRRAD